MSIICAKNSFSKSLVYQCRPLSFGTFSQLQLRTSYHNQKKLRFSALRITENFKNRDAIVSIYQRLVTLPSHYTNRSLRQQLKDWRIPRKWQHFLRIEKSVLVNGHYEPMNVLLHSGDQLSLSFKDIDATHQDYALDPVSQLTVLFENPDLIVADKPAGIKMHPNFAGENGTLMNAAESFLAAAGQHAWMVHRLDQATSGAVLIAKNPLVVPLLNRQLATKLLHREYLAVVPATRRLPDHGFFIGAIGQDPNDIRKRMVDEKNGQAANTEFTVLHRHSHFQLLLIKLHTGRTHQIRVHLAHAGLPIIGDPLYADEGNAGDGMLLHGWRLTWETPLGFGQQTVTTPIPVRFNPFLPPTMLDRQ